MAEDTLRRELREECGFELQIHFQNVLAVDYLFLEGEGINVRLESVFFSATFGRRMFDPLELDHKLVWLPAQEAVARPCRPSQVWMLREAMKSNGQVGTA